MSIISSRRPGEIESRMSASNYPLVTYVTDGIASAMARRRLPPGTGT
jgi:hypothetical protein